MRVAITGTSGLVGHDLWGALKDRHELWGAGRKKPDFVPHAPSAFVGDADLPLDFHCSDAVPRRAEQKHHVVPIAERSARGVERRACGRINLIAAALALVAAPGLNFVVARIRLTLWTGETNPEPCPHEVFQARFICREAFHELFDIQGFVGHKWQYSTPFYMCQVDSCHFHG